MSAPKNSSALYDDLSRDELIARINELETRLEKCQEANRNAPLINSILQHSITATAVFDENLCYLAANAAWCQLYDFKEAELIGEYHYDILPNISQSWRDLHQRCLLGAIESKVEERMMHLDGNVDWVTWSVYPWKNHEGNISGIVISTDIVTEKVVAREKQKQLLQEFSQSEQKSKAMIQGLPIMLFTADKQGIITLSEGLELSNLGIKAGQAVGKSLFDYYKDVPHFKHHIDRALAGEEIVFETYHPQHEQYFERCVTPLYDEKGDITGVIGVAFNVTERKQMEIQLTTSERHYRTVLENFPNGAVMKFDHDLRYTLVEGTQWADIGVDKSEIEGKTIFEVDDDRTIAILEPAYRDVISGKSCELTLEIAGHFYYSVLTPLYDDHGNLTEGLVVIQRVTERRLAEEQLRLSETRLQLLLSSLPIIVFALDAEGIFTMSEGKGLLELGSESGEFVGRSVFELYKDEITMIEYLKRAFAGEQLTYELQLNNQYFENTYLPLHDEQGVIKGIVGVAFNITERKQTEIQLANSERNYRTILENFPNGAVMKFDHDLRYTLVEGTQWADVGVDKNDIEGNTIFEIDDDRTIAILEPIYRDVLAGRARAKDLQFFGEIYRTSYTPMYDENGVVTEGLVITQCITERKRAEEQLALSETRLQLLLSSLPIIVFALDAQGVFTMFEGKGLTKLGLEPGQVVGMSAFEIYKKQVVMVEKLKLAFTGEQLTYEIQLGDEYFENTYLPLYDEQGEVTGLLGVTFIVTEQKQNEQALKAEKARFAAVYKAVPDTIVRVSKDGTFLDYKHSSYFGVHTDPNEVVGKSVYDNTPKELADKVMDYIKRTIETSEMHSFENMLVLNGEENYRENRFVKFDDNEAFAFIRDITELKKTEEALLETRQFLEEAQNIANMGAWSFNFTTKDIYWSKQVYDLMELPYDHPLDVVLVSSFNVDPKAFTKLIFNACTNYEPFEVEHECIIFTGKRRWIRTIARPVFDENGEFLKLVGTHQDITARKQSELQLKVVNERLARLNRLSILLNNVETDDDLLKVATEGVLGKNIASLLYPIYNEEREAIAYQIVANLIPESLESIASKILLTNDIGSRHPISPKVKDFFADNAVLCIEDMNTVEGIDKSFRDRHTNLGVESCVYIAFIQLNKVIALFRLGWFEPRIFSQEERAYFDALSALIAPIVAKRQLLDSLEQTIAQRTDELSQSRQLLRSTIDNTESHIFVKDLEGYCLLSNKIHSESLGFSGNEIIGKHDRDYLPSAIIEEVYKNDQEIINTGNFVRFEEKVGEGGEERIFITNKFPLKNDQGVIYAIGGITTDITEDRRKDKKMQVYQEELNRNRQLLRLTIDNAESIIFVKDIHGVFILANKAFLKLWNITEEEVIGKTSADFLSPAETQSVIINDRKVIATQKSITTEEATLRDDGRELLYISTKYPLLDNKGKVFGIGCITTDITEQRRREKEMQIYRDKVAKAETELQITQKIQELLLPAQEELESISELDIASYMKPAEEVGGDYYDVLKIGDSIKIGIGDVTGHGLESGLLMLMTQTAVRTLLSSHEHNASSIMNILNRTVFDNLQRMKVDKSLTLSLLDYQKGKLTLSGQHEHVLVIRQGGNIEVIDTMDLGMPLGLDEDISLFIAEERLELQPGEGAVLFTDGITEAENKAGEQFGLARLIELLAANWQQDSHAITSAIIADVYKHVGEHIIYDDITLVVFKRPLEQLMLVNHL